MDGEPYPKRLKVDESETDGGVFLTIEDRSETLHDDEIHELDGINNTDLPSTRCKRNQCPICSVQFDLEKCYVEHMLLVHDSKRPFRCEECGLYLSYRSSLYNHRKIHSDKKPFGCTDCNASFRWNNSLKYHMKRAHNKEPPWSTKSASLTTAPVVNATAAEAPEESIEIDEAVHDSAAEASAIDVVDSNVNEEQFENGIQKFFDQMLKSVSETILNGQMDLLLAAASAIDSTSDSTTNTAKHTQQQHESDCPSAASNGIDLVDSSTSSMLKGKIDRLSRQQRTLLQRLEQLEHWVKDRVGKIEVMLAAIVTGGLNLSQKHAASSSSSSSSKNSRK